MAGDSRAIFGAGECGLVAGGLRQTRQRTSQVITKKKDWPLGMRVPYCWKKAHQKNLTEISDDGELGLMQLMAND